MPILKIATALGLSLCLGAFAASAAEPTKTTIAALTALNQLSNWRSGCTSDCVAPLNLETS